MLLKVVLNDYTTLNYLSRYICKKKIRLVEVLGNIC